MTNLLTRVISGKRRNSNTNRKEKDEMPHARFSSSAWVKEPLSTGDGGYTQYRATTTLEYHVEGFTGKSHAAYLVTIHPDSAPEPNESGWFDGHETFVGDVAGSKGTVVMRSSGKIFKGKVSGEWTILEGTGKDGLLGIRGTGWYEYTTSGEALRGRGRGGMKIDFDEDKTQLSPSL